MPQATAPRELEISPLCRRWVDPSDTTLQFAVELRPAGPLGTELVEGPGVFFHAACYPWVRGHRSKPHPWAGQARAQPEPDVPIHLSPTSPFDAR